MKSITEVK